MMVLSLSMLCSVRVVCVGDVAVLISGEEDEDIFFKDFVRGGVVRSRSLMLMLML